MKHSAGVIAYKYDNGKLMVLLAHPGGPYYMNKDKGCWCIPKGELEEGEDVEITAKREFEEETGISIDTNIVYLGQFKQSNQKIISIYKAHMPTIDLNNFKSNTFELEWPPHSKQIQEYPEVDKIQWFIIDEAKEYILKSQIQVLNALI